jgi:hypothetical protein
MGKTETIIVRMDPELKARLEAYASIVRERLAKKPKGNIAGIVIDGTSKPEKRIKDPVLVAEAAETF